MSRWPSVLKWYEPVARMRGDRPQGHVGACSDAQANTTFEISGLVPRYDCVQRAAARSAPQLLVRMVEFCYVASGPLRLPADQSLLAGAGPAIAWFL
jgi:hypothetical protein